MPRKAGQITPRLEPHLIRIAELYFQNHARGINPQGQDLGVSSVPSELVRSTLEQETGQKFTRREIENAIKYWRKSGRIRVDILPEKVGVEQNYSSRQILDQNARLMEEYPLDYCVLVPGIVGSEGGYASEDDVARARVMRDIGEAAGKFLSDVLPLIIRQLPKSQGQLKPSLGICVGPGEAVRTTIDHISFRSNFKKVLIDIVPMTGLLGWRRVGPSPLANARRLEYVFSGDARLHWYSTPAIIPLTIEDTEACPDYNAHLVKKALENLPMVKEVDKLREKSTIYIFSVSDAPEVQKWASDRWHLISQVSAEEYEAMPHRRHAPAVGAISGLVFDREGKPVEDLPWLPMGVTLTELYNAARRIHRVDSLSVLIVGGHPNRVPAIKALLRAGCVNVLITDLYTAKEL